MSLATNIAGAVGEEIKKEAIKQFGEVKGSQIYDYITNFPLKGADAAEIYASWDDCKTIGENLANIIGDLMQGIILDNFLKKGKASIYGMIAAYIGAEILDRIGISLGDGTEKAFSLYKNGINYFNQLSNAEMEFEKVYNNRTNNGKVEFWDDEFGLVKKGLPSWNYMVNKTRRIINEDYNKRIKNLLPYYEIPEHKFAKFALDNNTTTEQLVKYNNLMPKNGRGYYFIPENLNLKLPNGKIVPFDSVCDVKNKKIMINVTSPTAYETDGKIEFTITLNRALNEDLTLKLSTIDGSAIGDEDFEKIEDKKIIIKSGNTSQKFSIKIAQDGKYEGKEEFMLKAVYEKDSYKGDDLKEVINPIIMTKGTILDFPQEECPTTPKPNIKPISLNLPPTLLYPTTGGGSWGSGGSWSGGGGWGSGGYYPLAPSKPSLPNVPYIECYNEPYLNSMMIVKLPSLNSTRSFVALNYMSKDNSFNLSSPLLKDSLNSLNNKALNLNTTTSNSNKIYFDMNSDGFKERMIEWINEDEAVLVNDINNNGLIDNGTEILGNNYISNLTGSKSLDSYLLLKEFDTKIACLKQI